MENSIQKVMTQKVISVSPETPLIQAVKILLERNFNGLPVVDKDGLLKGILTEHDMIIKGSGIHLPTFLKLLGDFEVYKKDSSGISDDIRNILKTKVQDVMNQEPFTLSENSTIPDAINAFTEHHKINPIPVVDSQGKLVGLVSRYDVVKLYSAPSVDFNMEDGDRELDKNVNRFLSDFGRQFIFVSKTRTHYWLLASILFAVVGFLIAFLIILRIQ